MLLKTKPHDWHYLDRWRISTRQPAQKLEGSGRKNIQRHPYGTWHCALAYQRHAWQTHRAFQNKDYNKILRHLPTRTLHCRCTCAAIAIQTVITDNLPISRHSRLGNRESQNFADDMTTAGKAQSSKPWTIYGNYPKVLPQPSAIETQTSGLMPNAWGNATMMRLSVDYSKQYEKCSTVWSERRMRQANSISRRQLLAHSMDQWRTA